MATATKKKAQKVGRTMPLPVPLRYTERYYGDGGTKTPLTDLLKSKLEEEIEFVTPEGEVIKCLVKEAIANIIISLVLEGDKWAIQFLTDRVEGKAVERVDLGSGTVPTSLAEFLYKGAYPGGGKDGG